MKKLYAVTVVKEMNIVVHADGFEEAASLALDNADDEDRNNGTAEWSVYRNVFEISTVDEIPCEWIDGIPYGVEVNDRTVNQLLKTTAEVVK